MGKPFGFFSGTDEFYQLSATFAPGLKGVQDNPVK
jgi:hypothetical protein